MERLQTERRASPFVSGLGGQAQHVLLRDHWSNFVVLFHKQPHPHGEIRARVANTTEHWAIDPVPLVCETRKQSTVPYPYHSRRTGVESVSRRNRIGVDLFNFWWSTGDRIRRLSVVLCDCVAECPLTLRR